MTNDKTFLLRNLRPNNYHFDGYNKIKCPNSRDKPFFSDNTIDMGKYTLTTLLVNNNKLSLEFSSICPFGDIIFAPYELTLTGFVDKLKEAIQTGADFISFEVTTSYSCTRGTRKLCKSYSKDCENLLLKNQKIIYAAVSFDTSEIKRALEAYFEIIKINGGNSTMKKKSNLLGMNFEFGMCKDSNIASTLMGVAVKNPTNGSWYTYDTATNSRKNLANFKMGNFPVMLVPATNLVNGDLIKYNGEYCYVKNVSENKTLTLINAASGVIQEIVAEGNLLNMTMYTKVVAFDVKTLTDPKSNQGIGNNMLAAVCMMSWAKGKTDDFSIDSIDDDSFNGMGAYLPLLLANNGGNGLFGSTENGGMDFTKLMLLGSMSGDSDTDGMTQMLVLSQLLGQNNPISSVIPGFDAATTSAGADVACEKCGATYPAGTNFCSKCGGETKSVSNTCPNCNATVNAGDAFCTNCGKSLKANTCPNCGKELAAGANFCSACGTDLNAATTETPAEVTTE